MSVSSVSKHLLKLLNSMANVADPDQTAAVDQSDVGLHCLLREAFGIFIMSSNFQIRGKY